MELLVVIAILALVTGLSVAQLSTTTDGAVLRAETRKLISHLRAMRSRSLAESRVYTVTTIENRRGYLVQPGDEQVALPEPVTINLNGGRMSARLPGAVTSIEFYPDGSASGGTVTLSADSDGRKIAVNWMTGEVALAPET